jgi:hypothetical protein
MRITRSPRLAIAAAVALLAAVAVPAVAFADTTGGVPSIPPAASRNATISVTSVSVTAKVIAAVNVAFICQPLTYFDWRTGQDVTTTDAKLDSGQATIVQAQGRTIDWGLGDAAFGQSMTCDGTHVNQVTMPVTASVAPWKTGTAVVGAAITVIDPQGFTGDYASSGPVTVRLAGR